MEKQGIERRGLMALLAGSALAMATRPSLADDAIDPEAKEAVTKMGKTLSTGAFSFRSYAIRQVREGQPATPHLPLCGGAGPAS